MIFIVTKCSIIIPQVVFKRVQWMYNETDGSTQVGGYVKHYQNLALVTVKVGTCSAL